MRKLIVMFVTAVCFLFLLKSKWPKNKNFYNSESSCRIYALVVKHLTLNDWSRGERWILFPENLPRISIRGKQNSLFPKGPVIKWFVIEQNKTKAKFENCAEIPAITWNSGQHFAGNSELFPVWRHSFRNVARSWHLAGNGYIVRCHVTMN